MAIVSLNGEFIGVTGEWTQNSIFALTVKQGDVIQIDAEDFGVEYGAIAARGTCSTKIGQGPWFVYEGAPSPLLPGVKSSIVPPAPGSSNEFPYSTGAEYVWAAGAGEKSKVTLVLRVTNKCYS